MQSIRPISNTLLQHSTRSATSSCRAAYLTTSRRDRRTFISNPFGGSQTLSASRTLQYPSKIIYSIISDVNSYSTFLPYCQGSVVTKHSSPASDGKQYPEEAKLVIGFNNDVSEQFWSRVYCVPESVVEAVSGQTETTLSAEEIKHHNARPSADQDPSRKDTVLSHLLTRWTLRPYPYKPPPTSATHPTTTHMNHKETNPVPGFEKTEVNLHIEFQFANPVYGALSSAAAPKVADKMIEAFVRKVKAVAEGPASVDPSGR